MIQLLHELREAGIRLRLRGENVEFVAPKGAMTEALLLKLRASKAELREYLLLREGRNTQVRLEPAACLLPLEVSGERTPVFFAPPAGGTAFCYKDLSKHLGPTQPVYGLRSPGWTTEPPVAMAEMAAIYNHTVRSVQPRGPYRIGAWSLGGITALEMARQLAREGETVERLILLDPPAPPVTDLHAFVVRVLGQLVIAFQHLIGMPMQDSQELVKHGDIDRFFAEALRAVDGAKGPLASPEVVLRCKRILLTHMEAFQDYQMEGAVSCGRTLLIFTEDARITNYLGYFRSHIEGPFDVKLLHEPHALMVLEPHVQRVSEYVRKVLED